MARLRTIKNYGSAGWKINLLQQDIEDLKFKDDMKVDIDLLIENQKIKNIANNKK